MLYSEAAATLVVDSHSFSTKIPTATLELLAGLDHERLNVERNARLGALNRALAASLPALYDLLTIDDAKVRLRRFANTDDFWSGTGRTIGEAFAIFLAASADLPIVVREMAQLAGVMSGLVAAPMANSPWPNVRHVNRHDDSMSIHAEQFETRHALVDPDGQFLTASEMEMHKLPTGRYRLLVAAVDRESCAVSCTPITKR